MAPSDDDLRPQPLPTLDDAAWLPGVGQDVTTEETQRYVSLERMLQRARAEGLAPEEPTEEPGEAPVRYRVERVLGRGGVGEVLLAKDVLLEREVALKSLQANTPRARRAFWHEARVTATLDHPAIMPVYDAGALEGSGPYFAMKRVEGQDLYQLVSSGAAPPVRRRIELFLRACEAVAYAHARGWLHRDLKPENIMVGPYGEVLVADWGLAWPVATASAAPPAGTPNYMPPEQVTGTDPGVTADVYALGGTLWFLLSGQVPWAGETVETILARLRDGTCFVPPSAGVAPELVSIARKALSPHPADRYPQVDAMKADLEAWLDGEEVAAHRYGTLQRLGRWTDRHGRRLLVAATLAAALAGVVAASSLLTGAAVWRSLVVTQAARAESEQAERDAVAAEAATRVALQDTLVANAAARMAIGDANGAQGVLREARALGPNPLVELAAVDVFGGGIQPIHRWSEEGVVDVRLADGAAWALTRQGWVQWSLRDGAELGRGSARGRPVAWLSDGTFLAHAPDRWLRLTTDGTVVADAEGPPVDETVWFAGEVDGELWLQTFHGSGRGRTERRGLDLGERSVPPALRGGFLHRAAADGMGAWTFRRNPDRTKGGHLVELATGRKVAPLPSMLSAWEEGKAWTQRDGDVCVHPIARPNEASCAASAGPYAWIPVAGGTVLATEAGETVLRAARHGEVVERLDGAVGRPLGHAAADGWLATARTDEVVVWALPDLGGGAFADRGWSHQASPHPRGRLVAVAMDDRILLVDAPTGRHVATWLGLPRLGLGWSRSGGELLVGGPEGADVVALEGPAVELPVPGMLAPWADGVVVHDVRTAELHFLDLDGTPKRPPVRLPGSTWAALPAADGSVVLAPNFRRGPVLAVHVAPDGSVERWQGASPDYLGFGAARLPDGRHAFTQQSGALILRQPDGGTEDWSWQREALLDVTSLPVPGVEGGLAAVDYAGRLHLLLSPTRVYTAPVADTLRFAVVADDTLVLSGGRGVHRRRLDAWPADTVQGRLLQAGAFRLAAAHGIVDDEHRLSLALVTGEGIEEALGDRDDPVARLYRRWAAAGADTPVVLGD